MSAPSYHIVRNYVVGCYRCERDFDASAAGWCRCVEKTRTLKCPHCLSCFCRAPIPYKERFWSRAPRLLCANTNRFCIGDGSSTTTAALSPPRVLIVDDEEHMRSLVVCYVEQMGYEVTSATGPEEALELLAAGEFDVVITDALMPRMDGREMCRHIKQEYGDRIKVIVMTSLYTATRFKTEARHRFGVDDYMAKPLQFGILKTALDRIAPIGQSSAHSDAQPGSLPPVQ